MTTILALLPAYESYLRHERQLADLSIVAYLSDLHALGAFLTGKEVSRIEINDLRAYMRNLSEQGFKVASIRRKFHGFGTFWRWLKMEGHTSDVITEQLRLPRKPQLVVKWLNAHDLKRFVDTPVNRRDPFIQARDSLAWRLLAWLGLRRSELLNLDVQDIRLVDDVIVIRAGKGKKDRVLPLPMPLKDDLIAFIGDRRAGPLLLSERGTKWAVKSFNRAFQRHLRACNLEGQGITAHTLRHSFATHLVMAGVPITTVSTLLGHADIQSTMIYVHTDMEHLRAALAEYVLNNKSAT